MNEEGCRDASQPVRGLGLLSGGLDSSLAVRVLQEQGIEVACVNFHTGFCIQSHTGAIRNPKKGAEPARHDALHAAQSLGVKLHMVDISKDYVRIVTDPKHGYGKNLNPCLDCKIFMVQKAWELKEKLGFDFIFTGEVMGQRPMSQRKDTFPVIDREAGVKGWLLRPLSAQYMPETEPEKNGWVNREKLKNFTGRSRKPQMALAQEYNLTDYPTPAGGCCFLTDENYSRKLQDLWNNRQTKEYSMEDIVLLKAGRHLRPANNYKIIIGRDESENNFLSGLKAGRLTIRAKNLPGPFTLVEGEPNEEELKLACRIAARYGKGKNHHEVTMVVEGKQTSQTFTITPMPAHEILKEWHV
ncbi:MAG: tRNA (5-methylaminomethyl-2-thiouridylate)-methyltransferase [Magnetococcales bacterium]|nr:tRNA (5-methylaminomethyl-2-thiouridylate)-methyltransferase [Magnetococcales bacterium]